MIDWHLPEPLAPEARVGEPAERYRGYRVPSARLAGRDYGAGWFFVTFVTRGRARCLGRLARGRFVPSAAGRVVIEEWRRTGVVRPGVRLDAVAVLPDHVHAIVGIVDGRIPSNGNSTAAGRDAPRGVSTVTHPASDGACERGDPSWRPGVLGAVVNHWKGACTRRIRRDIDPAFGWQPRFYDVVVRDARRLDAARRYVRDNAAIHAARGDYA